MDKTLEDGAGRLRENASALESWINSMLTQLREDEFYGQLGIEMRTRANMELGLRIASSVKDALNTIADHLAQPSPVTSDNRKDARHE